MYKQPTMNRFTMCVGCCSHVVCTVVTVDLVPSYTYRILQIVRGGKVLQLQNSTVTRWKTFAVGPSLPFFFYNLLSEGNYFTGKVSQLPTDL